MMYYLIYKTTNLVNNKFYIGKHKTDNLDDSYLGSGYALISAIKKYGKDNFTREILYFCETLEEMNLLEETIIDQDFILRKNNYNIVLGGGGGCIALYKENPKYQEICEKISNANKGKIGWNKGLTKETSESVRVGHAKTTETRKLNGSYVSKRKGIPISESTRQLLSMAHIGKTVSPETKTKMSESHKKRVARPDYVNSMTGKVGANKGKTASEETKKRMSDAKKKCAEHPNYVNPMQGKHRSDELKNILKISNSNGTYITPWGNFVGAQDAVKHPNSPFKDGGAIRARCKKKVYGYDFIPKN